MEYQSNELKEMYIYIYTNVYALSYMNNTIGKGEEFYKHMYN